MSVESWPGAFELFTRFDTASAAGLSLRCPSTAQTVQERSADDVTDDDTSYQSVACLACAQLHLIKPKTGKVVSVEILGPGLG